MYPVVVADPGAGLGLGTVLPPGQKTENKYQLGMLVGPDRLYKTQLLQFVITHRSIYVCAVHFS